MTKDNLTTNLAKETDNRSVYSYAVTGTFHGSIVEAKSEGEARRIFHKYYNGESITHVRNRGNLPALA